MPKLDTRFVGDSDKVDGLDASQIKPYDYETKNADFTCVAKTLYFVDTTNGSVTATLPDNPNNFDYIGFVDLKGTFDTNNLVIAIPSGATYTIMGLSENMNVDVKNASVELIYYNGDWRVK